MRRRRQGRPGLGRIAGYGGAVLLAVAAVVVLLMPVLGEEKGRTGASGTGTPAVTDPAGPTPGPGGTAPSAVPTNPVQRSGGNSPAPGSTGGTGPLMPGDPGAGAGLGTCPPGTAFHRATAAGLEVVITVATSGAIRAEVELRGRSPLARQATVKGGAPHTFRFAGVAPQLVERVKVTTVSVGAAMQSCYSQPGT
ncbi:hypothetical protein [Spirillospora albida]|uniref:hypothetical protein n=1 Tax=Spirillospora albida TaxID=58123 RepID=UPI0004C24A25|nr:hypothetical protein [Spirillospora albida]